MGENPRRPTTQHPQLERGPSLTAACRQLTGSGGWGEQRCMSSSSLLPLCTAQVTLSVTAAMSQTHSMIRAVSNFARIRSGVRRVDVRTRDASRQSGLAERKCRLRKIFGSADVTWGGRCIRMIWKNMMFTLFKHWRPFRCFIFSYGL